MGMSGSANDPDVPTVETPSWRQRLSTEGPGPQRVENTVECRAAGVEQTGQRRADGVEENRDHEQTFLHENYGVTRRTLTEPTIAEPGSGTLR
ncbi:hypothetical protein [Nocardia asteroides]|uniref:hypothetical protein n=1 Tax=Nocardia asteroides TaxID=1824 RepID=UPI00341EABE3